MKVLLAEDEKKVSHFIRKALREAGYEVETAYEGNQAMDQAGKQTFDVIVLDIMMPGKDGLAVLRRLREEKNATPVMLLTARGEVSQRVEGLELGADDYLAKPFAMRELIARVNALSRRSSGERATILRIGRFEHELADPRGCACGPENRFSRARVWFAGIAHAVPWPSALPDEYLRAGLELPL